MQYRDEGFLPEALLNYLARLGWSHGDQEIFSMEEMIRLFRGHETCTPRRLRSIREAVVAQPALHQDRRSQTRGASLSHHLGKLDIDPARGPDLIEVVKAQRERAKTLSEMATASAFFYKDVEAYEPKDAAAHLKPEILEPLTELRERLAGLPQWNAEAIHTAVNGLAEARGLKLGKIAQPLRVAVAGARCRRPIDQTLALLDARGHSSASIAHSNISAGRIRLIPMRFVLFCLHTITVMK